MVPPVISSSAQQGVSSRSLNFFQRSTMPEPCSAYTCDASGSGRANGSPT